MATEHLYDVMIIGGGPAGLTAGLYAARSRLKALLLEKTLTGGQAFSTEMIENYPGFPQGISGPELTSKMRAQAEAFGLEIKTGFKVDTIESSAGFTVYSGDETLESKTIIIATGADSRKLGIAGESEFTGRGVSYCATCDGAFFKDRTIAVVGGGDAAIEEALFLTKFASRVFVIHRRAELRATKVLQERAFNHDKIEFIWDSVPESIEGGQSVESISIRNVKTDELTQVDIAGVFFYIGTDPNTSFLPKEVNLDEKGYIVTDARLATSVQGIFAAGDVRRNQLKQVIVAASEGAIAAMSVEKYMEEHEVS